MITDFNLGNCNGLVSEAFTDVDIVVHAAARVHIMNDDVFDF